MKLKYASAAAVCLLSSVIGQSVIAAETDTDVLRNQINELTRRLDALEKEEKPGTTVVQDGAFAMPGTNTTIKFGGYIQADLIHDSRFDNGPFLVGNNTPEDSVDDNPNTMLQARQSRLNVLTSTDVGTGTPLEAFLEVDAIGADGNEVFSNSHGIRLRHAYVKYGRYMAGQYWSNFQDFVAYPQLLDVSSPAGRVFVRQTQFRVNMGQFALSLENPETQPVAGTSNQAESLGGVGEDRLPDFIVSWRGGPGGALGAYQVSGLLRELGVNGTVNGVAYDDQETGWGANVAGRWALGPAVFKANAAYGEGIGRYINYGWGNDMRLNADGSVDVITSWGASAAMEYSWTPRTASTFSYGHFENDDDYSAFDTKSVDTYRVNYRWTPFTNLMVGAEAMYAVRDFTNGTDGDNTRLQFSVRRSF